MSGARKGKGPTEKPKREMEIKEGPLKHVRAKKVQNEERRWIHMRASVECGRPWRDDILK